MSSTFKALSALALLRARKPFVILNGARDADDASMRVACPAEVALHLQQQSIALAKRWGGKAYAGVRRGSLGYKNFVDSTAELRFITMAQLAALDDDERRAFFVNLYNALLFHAAATIKVPIRLALRSRSFFTSFAYAIADTSFTLDDIEHGVLRENLPIPGKNRPQFLSCDPRLSLRVSFDPRIHFVLVCGGRSSPPIRLYTAANIDIALGTAAKAFCASEVVLHPESHRVELSPFLRRFAADFGVDTYAQLTTIATYLPESTSTMLRFMMASGRPLTLSYRARDWSLNAK